MLLYIKNLLPRLRQYSQTLDKIELLVEHPWVLIDDENNQQKYIFRRNGDLLMSINGKGIKGKWEYLTVAKSLWIDRGQDNIMLNHDFVDPAVMVLKMDGNKDMPFVLANENLIPDMDVIRYLSNNLAENFQYSIGELSSKPKVDNTKNKEKPTKNERGKWGYLNHIGEVLVDYKYDGAYDFIGDLAIVYKSKGNQDFYGFIDKKGNEVIRLIYEYAENFSDGLALVRLERRFGFIDNIGNVKIPIQFNDAESFKIGRAKVMRNGRHFIIDSKGNEL